METDTEQTREASEVAIERAVLAAIAEGVVVSDAEGRVILVNAAAARMLGADREAALGRPLQEVLEACPDPCRSTIVAAVARLSADPYTSASRGEAVEVTLQVGAQTLHARVSPLLTDIGQFVGTAILVRDATDEAQAEQSKEDFVRHAAHEMTTPLTAIRGYSELLARQLAAQLDEQQARFLRIVLENAGRLERLLVDLVDISQLESGQLELQTQPVQMEDVIRTVADQMRAQCDEKGLRLVIDIEPGVGPVLGDVDRLTQVVTALVRNACRHTAKGGRLTLSLSRVDDEVRVDVADTGVGIAPERQAGIFQRFYRPPGTDRRTANLALPLSKGLIEMHGGRLWVESALGQGSTFSFTLPMQVAPPAAEAVEPVGPSAAQRTVLVVEDDADVAQLIELQLRQEGFQVLSTDHGEEAVRLAQTEQIDLVTLDIMLPDIRGTEVLSQLKANPETAHIPVVIVSVLKPDSFTGLDVADHLTKPFSLDRLMATIRRALPVG